MGSSSLFKRLIGFFLAAHVVVVAAVLPLSWAFSVNSFRYEMIGMDPEYLGEETGTKEFAGEVWHVQYLNDEERKAFEVFVREGRLVDARGRLINAKNAILVMGSDGRFLLSLPQRGKFHHSSFFRGKPVAGAGMADVENGVLRAFIRQTGHYKSDGGIYNQMLYSLHLQKVDLAATNTEYSEMKWMGDLDAHFSTLLEHVGPLRAGTEQEAQAAFQALASEPAGREILRNELEHLPLSENEEWQVRMIRFLEKAKPSVHAGSEWLDYPFKNLAWGVMPAPRVREGLQSFRKALAKTKWPPETLYQLARSIDQGIKEGASGLLVELSRPENAELVQKMLKVAKKDQQVLSTLMMVKPVSSSRCSLFSTLRTLLSRLH